MKPLYDLQQELNRLFIAGSKFAKNDPRLQKHVSILKKLGEKAPVFNKLAQEVEALLQVESTQTAEKLLGVSTLLYSVLYTQGITIEAEATKESQIPTIQLADVNTTYSYLQLKPVLQALTQSNSGRLEILQDAFERKVFDDSRTYEYLSYALADKYSELTYYVENTIIPACGKAMIPFLIADFRLEDKNENVRRLRLLYQLGYAEIGTLVDKIFSENLPNLQAEAIDIIADKKDEQTEAFIISLTGDKNKAVRGAAYSALAKLGTQRSIDKLYELYNTNKQKGNAELLAEAIAKVAVPEYFLPFVEKIQERYQQLLTIDDSDEKALSAAFERFVIDIDILANKDCEGVYRLFAEMLQNKEFNTRRKKVFKNTYDPTANNMTGVLNTLNSDKVLAFYDTHKQLLSYTNGYSDMWINYFYSAFKNENYSKEKLFEVFSSQLGKSAATDSILEAFSGIAGAYAYNARKESEVRVDRLDPRWVDTLYSFINSLKKLNNNYTYRALFILDALEGTSQRLDDLLLKALSQSYSDDMIWLFHLVLKRNFPNKFEVIYHTLERVKAGNSYYYLYYLSNADFWNKFPKEYVEKFRALAKKNKLNVFEDIADEIEKSVK
ncbi:HEAT repeat domain-containing protein [Capnocytophaga genosp. AHN8471]|uniref:HEAT repeat domain-containing protein n=1 Tax=Capnocytophaga genosp. AHN8471 TaxID=327574 RepID=A0ABS1YW08_9FLAO|nr:HEAT repeat domain-containing protein [Capnocytophaga genosp. AHN8471]MBM0650603.1 HEAT repeat domain-containing protein [Capnocytophaga genosp. AHN8471]MBM0661791.1 HEAT repeat domain-containing protein [Capnocytophaga genosp. AHN8471]